MDDYNVNVLSEAKNEYSSRLVSTLTPLLIQGIKSIFNEALNLCKDNGENEKYLMMFQNMIARIPGWNATLITKEVERITDSSQIGYLPDLVTAVHIIHLRILSSVRVGAKPKHIELDPPDFERFIHKVYCECGRKMWTHAYLFRTDVNDIDFQRNMHECEKIIRDAVICTIRATLPVENILRAYIEEAEEIRVEEEIDAEISEPIEEKPKSNEILNENAQESANQSDVKNLVSAGLTVLKESEPEVDANADTESNVTVQEPLVKPSVVFASNNEVLDMGTNKTSVIDMAPPPRVPARMPGPPLEEVSLRSLAPATGATPPTPSSMSTLSTKSNDPLEVIDLNVNNSLSNSTMPTLKLDISDF